MEHSSQKCVRPLYMENSQLLKHRAKIVKISSSEVNKKRYQWVLLDETIFHPKGGGQPSDQGTINGIQVVHVAKELLDKDRIDFFEILHCFDECQELFFKEGDEVELIVDGAKRQLFSRMHTAGHLIAEVTHALFPKFEAFHGNHEPDNGYVRFKMLEPVNDAEEVREKIQRELSCKLQEDIPVYVTKTSQGTRAIQIGQMMPCGGTHVSFLKEIGRVEITGISINNKEQTLTMKYRLKDVL